MSGIQESSIDNLDPSVSIYVGADPATGRLKFAGSGKNNLIGPDFRGGYAGGDVSIGAAATLALGLTECCACIGRGKVYYFRKLTESKDSYVRNLPNSYIRLPDLLYVDYKWTAEEAETWLRSPHWQRLDLLSARGGNVGVSIPTLPITLSYERQNYLDIQFFDGLGEAILYYNFSGVMYLGFMTDLSAAANFVRRTRPHRSRYMAKKTDIAQFQIRSGSQAVETLRNMFHQQRPDTLFTYGSILRASIAAHRGWVAAGGYCIEEDPLLGQTILARAAKARARLMATPPFPVAPPNQGVPAPPPNQAGAPDALVEEEGGLVDPENGSHILLQEVAMWSDVMKTALEDYTNAVSLGVEAVARFMVRDANWASLSAEEKEKVIDIWVMEKENASRGAGTGAAGTSAVA